MRELVWIAGHLEHRNSERKLQVQVWLGPTSIWGSLLHLPQCLCKSTHCEYTGVRCKQCDARLRLNWSLQLGALACAWVDQFSFRMSVTNWTRVYTVQSKRSTFWPQISREHSLNLSILLSEGKETNKYSPSNGEWTGKSSKPNRFVFGAERYVAYSSSNGWVVRV